jgi:hypothetical protein
MNPALLLGFRRKLMDSAPAKPSDVRERVAFELMTKIAEEERANPETAPEPAKDYYLKLYCQCLRIVSGEDVEDVLDTGSG